MIPVKFVLIALLFPPTVLSREAANDCLKNKGMDESFFMMTGIRKSTDIFKSSSVKYTHIAGGKDCKGYHNVSSPTFGHMPKSTCPGYYVLNYDKNRIPGTILEVRCACSVCIADSNSNRCVSVNHVRLVKRRARAAGSESWTTVLESYTVGCTCMRPGPQGLHPHYTSVAGK